MFPENLRKFRKQRGMTHQTLAAKLNISVDTVRRWEQGKRKPRYEDIDNLAMVLSISRDTLMGDAALDNTLSPVCPMALRQNNVILVGKEEGGKKTRAFLPLTVDTCTAVMTLFTNGKDIADSGLCEYIRFWASSSESERNRLLEIIGDIKSNRH